VTVPTAVSQPRRPQLEVHYSAIVYEKLADHLGENSAFS